MSLAVQHDAAAVPARHADERVRAASSCRCRCGRAPPASAPSPSTRSMPCTTTASAVARLQPFDAQQLSHACPRPGRPPSRADRPRCSSRRPRRKSAPLTSTETVRAKLKTRSMSCSISSTDTSAGSALTMSKISWRSPSGTPATGSSSSRTRGWQAKRDGDLQQAAACRRRAARPSGPSRRRDGTAPSRTSKRSAISRIASERLPQPPPGTPDAELGRDRERERLQRRQFGEELVDLEGAHDAAPDPRSVRRAAW